MLPAFYDPQDVYRLYEPDFQRAHAVGARDFRTPASQDDPRFLLWLVDVQIDFCFPVPQGRLTVPNALEDTRRTVEWLYRNTQRVSQIVASLDTHIPYQIFFPGWWKNEQGEHPMPYTVIPSEEVHSGKWIPLIEPNWSAYYVDQLERGSKKQLMIWPYHCLQGSAGQALVPALAEAIMYHSAARMAQPTYIVKGTIAETEFYSVLEPEVKMPSHPNGGVNENALALFSSFDAIYVAGQARSHCVLETMNSVLRYFQDDAETLGKIRFLDDCSSSIIGFEDSTETRIREWQQLGVQLVQSNDPIVHTSA
jgi:nicotinamidase-related amidase